MRWEHKWEHGEGAGKPDPLVPPMVFMGSSISEIIHKKSLWSFSSFGVVQNRRSDVAFPGPDFQLPEFSLLVCSLQIMREKALELLQKALLWIKTL